MKVDLIACPKCGASLTRPPWTPFVCPVCKKLAHIPGVASRGKA